MTTTHTLAWDQIRQVLPVIHWRTSNSSPYATTEERRFGVSGDLMYYGIEGAHDFSTKSNDLIRCTEH